MKGELSLSQTTECLLDTICSEMKSTLILSAAYTLGLDINTLFQEKQMILWNSDSSKGKSIEVLIAVVHFYIISTQPSNNPKPQPFQ